MTSVSLHQGEASIKVGVITVSDKGSRGERVDLCIEEIRKLLPQIGGRLAEYTIIPDEEPVIIDILRSYADQKHLDLIITSGGTGLSPRDVTPDATKKVIEKEIPGMAEAMRLESLKKTPFAMLSRGIAGTRGVSLIINLPGSPRGVRENLTTLIPVISHALDKLHGDPAECGSL
ncbi:MAG: MogA/MoaB family molybdenum cofactor biosynthesis protein [Deltaproteobacteria bacterium]|nr:MogA/MoaB family molybdenum cofactor biosynthesis protein [Deltaproteobacteria bacterium]